MNSTPRNISRINIIALTILRYLIEKNQPISFEQLHLEWSFCNISEQWDMSDNSLKQLLSTMIRNDLLDKIEGEKETLYAITPDGYKLVANFISIDKNILAKKWSITKT